MGSLPTIRNFLVLLLATLATGVLVGCQGFSSGKPAAQGSQQTPAAGALSATPASLTFGNVQVGTSQSQAETLINSGGATVNLTQANFTGAGFSTTGLTLPAALSPGQSLTFSVVFTPQSAGSASATLGLVNDGSDSPLNIALAGTAVAAGSLTGNPTSFLFGNVQLGASQSQTETLTNSGGQSITVSQASFTGTGFSYTGLTLPLTLAPNQSTTFAVVFSPTTAGADNSILSITSSASSTTLDFALSGMGVSPAVLTATPTSMTFNSVQVGKSQSQTETIQNIGGSTATITQASAAGNGFSISGINPPVVLLPGQTASFSVTFAPQTSGASQGSVSITSNASNPSLTISLNGSTSGQAQGQLSVSPTTINVGNVTVGSSGSQTGTLIASGASVTVSADTIGSSEFAISGLSFPVTVTPGKNVDFIVTFTPQTSGLASVNISFTSNASNSPSSATVTGTGVAAPVHDVNLSWTASTSPNIAGYNIYRRTGSSGNYTRINSVLDVSTSYTDSSVTDGQTYYYETTAVNSGNEESAPSSPVEAVIPAP